MVGAWKSNINGNDKVSTYAEQVYHDGKKTYEMKARCHVGPSELSTCCQDYRSGEKQNVLPGAIFQEWQVASHDHESMS